MTHSRLLSAAGIILMGILVIFFLSVPHAQEVTDQTGKGAVSSAPTIPVITLSDSYAKGVHTYSGTFLAPSACTSLSADAVLNGSASSTQTVSLSLTYPADTGVCLQLPTKTPFFTTLEAPKDATVTVDVNGVLASTSDS